MTLIHYILPMHVCVCVYVLNVCSITMIRS